MPMGTITREQIALKAERSVWTLRRWEREGLLPKARLNGASADYNQEELIPGKEWKDVISVTLQVRKEGRSLFFQMRDGSMIWMKSQGELLRSKSTAQEGEEVS